VSFHYVGGKQVVSTDSISSISNFLGGAKEGGGVWLQCSAPSSTSWNSDCETVWDTVGGWRHNPAASCHDSAQLQRQAFRG